MPRQPKLPRVRDSPADNPPDPKARPAIIISKETTCLTGPLRKDGTVDYVEALDRLSRQGVTPENNAAVPFWKAMGPAEILPQYREEYFRRIGMPSLPEQGDYYVNLKEFLTSRKHEFNPNFSEAMREIKADANFDALLEPALKRPWSKQEYPRLAAWLAANEKPLALIAEASRRPRRYDPLIGGKKTPLMIVPFPATAVFSEPGNPAQALVARAMLRLGDGKVDLAWEDSLTCHRLARLVGQGSALIDALTAYRLDEQACQSDIILLEHAPLTSARIAKLRQDIERLPPLTKFADVIDSAERFTYLDNIAMVSKEGVRSLAVLASIGNNKSLNQTIHLLLYYEKNTPIDWNIALRMGNALFDRIAAANRLPARTQQKEALKKIKTDLEKLKRTAADTASLEKLICKNPRRVLSERLGQVFLALWGPQTLVDLSIKRVDDTIMRQELQNLAFALAAFHADHHTYPEKLSELSPCYISSISRDVCNDSALHYQRNQDGYLLYSVGNNRRDDGGKTFEDRVDNLSWSEMKEQGLDWDDLAVRIPVPEIKSKKPPKKKQPSAEDALQLADFSKTVRQYVKELDYSDQTAKDVAQMVVQWHDWHTDHPLILKSIRQLGRAKRDFAEHKIGKAEMAETERKIVDDLCESTQFLFFYNIGHASLTDVVRDQLANCFGYSQLFYVLGRSLGLSVQVIWVGETYIGSALPNQRHTAGLVALADGKVMMVDLANRSVSDPFFLKKQYRPIGDFWEIRDPKNLLGLHPFIQVLDKNGILACMLYNKATRTIAAGKLDHVIEDYTQAIELHPKFAEAYCNRGLAYQKSGEKDKALADFRKAIELNPKFSAAYQVQGTCYLVSSQFDQAIADFTKALELNPQDAGALFARGFAYARKGNKQAAKNDLKKAAAIDPTMKDKVKALADQYQIDL
ncbi:MAG: tetratricopeptide repeat protein [Pirellulales bacterium]|nr:tetratricopeptide repeat protein [Pirellulales bacterium]